MPKICSRSVDMSFTRPMQITFRRRDFPSGNIYQLGESTEVLTDRLLVSLSQLSNVTLVSDVSNHVYDVRPRYRPIAATG